jgi:DNA modification methylase
MTVRIITADVMDGLAQLESESVHCVVTSPPYFGLRDYGTAQWEGGNNDCSHEPPSEWIDHNFNTNSAFGMGAKTQSAAAKGRWYDANGSCRCGARRVDKQIGLEPTPDAYVSKLVEVFREVRRVLRKDGTCWLNLGDSYARAGGWSNNNGLDGVSRAESSRAISNIATNGQSQSLAAGLKSKDLIGIPWRVAFALQADGWWLRQDIIWSKPNPMPESVTDRCTKAHEYIFLLTKAERYFYDAVAIADIAVCAGGRAGYAGYSDRAEAMGRALSGNEKPGVIALNSDTRNKRSVWEVATFPPALIEPCIKAGCPEWGTVLDPFGGSGTTGLVADRLKRNAILIELNPEYAAMAERRVRGDSPLFAEVSA